MMMPFVTMPKRIRTDGKGQEYHEKFKRPVLDEFNTKDGQAGHQQR